MTNSEILMIIFTGVIATTGVLGSIIFNNQLAIMQGQLGEMKSASEQTKRSADAAQRSADIAKDTLVATQRPWIAIQNQIASGLTRSEGGLNIGISYNIENVGNTPALYVHPEQKIFIGHGVFALQDEMKKFSESVRANVQSSDWGDLRRHIGTFIFPNRDSKINVHSTIGKTELDAITNPPEFLIYIFSIVQYLSPTDKQWHQTGMIYELRHAPTIPMRYTLADSVFLVDVPDVDPENLYLRPWLAGAYAD